MGAPSIRDVLESPDPVSQYGHRTFLDDDGRQFRHRPRSTDTDGLSITATAVPPLRIAQVCLGRAVRNGDGVRFSTVTRLQQAGFRVTPTPRRRNPGHMSVQFEGDWDAAVAQTFDRCFTDGLFVGVATEATGTEATGREAGTGE